MYTDEEIERGEYQRDDNIYEKMMREYEERLKRGGGQTLYALLNAAWDHKESLPSITRKGERWLERERQVSYNEGYLQGQCDIAPDIVDKRLDAKARD